MIEPEKPSLRRRSYPAIYEKLIPIALAAIVVAMLAAIGFAIAVALRLLPGAIP